MKINRIIIEVLIVASGVFASFFGGSLTHGIFYFMIIIPVVCFLYTFFVYSRFKIYQTIETKTVMKEEPVPYFFTLANEDFITYTNIRVTFLSDKSVIDSLDFDKSYCLFPSDCIKKTTTLRCHYRGEYNVGVDSVYITDFLNIFKIKYPAPTTLNMRVLPRIVEIDNPSFIPLDYDQKNQSYSFSSNNEQPDIDTRKYIKGDSRKMIHWKASAKQGELLTRKYIGITKTEAVFIVDLSEPEGDTLFKIIAEDKIIESALCAAKYFLKAQIPVRLIYDNNGITEFTLNKKHDFDVFYNSCIDMKFSAKNTSSDLLFQSTKYISRRSFCLIITHTISEELCRQCVNSLNAGADISIIYIYKDNCENVEILDKRINISAISSTEEISDVLSGR